MAERESIWDLISTLSSSSGLLGISAESLDLSGLSFLTSKRRVGSLGGAAVWRLPLAQGVVLETPDRVPHQALPVSLPLSLCVSHE